MLSRNSIPPQLLRDVENYCNVTWQDDATDDKFKNMIAAVAAYLEEKIRGPVDYEADGMPRTLLLEGVRYMRDSAFDVFESNFQSLILTAQQEGMVLQYGLECTVSPEN